MLGALPLNPLNSVTGLLKDPSLAQSHFSSKRRHDLRTGRALGFRFHKRGTGPKGIVQTPTVIEGVEVIVGIWRTLWESEPTE